ncbi:MAG: M28 family peptidase [Flavobacteriales bacterium]
MNTRIVLFSALALVPAALSAQLMLDSDVLEQMSYDVKYLASDRLEGREAGTPGEKLAADYIAAKFGNAGLMPYGDSTTYLQSFTFAAEPVLGPDQFLQIGRSTVKLDEGYRVLPFSGSGPARGKLMRAAYGIQAADLGTDNYKDLDPKGRVVALSISSPDGIHPHSKYLAYHDLKARAEKAAELGAIAVIYYNDDPTAEEPEFEFSPRVKSASIPVVYLTGESHYQLAIDNNPVVLRTDIQRAERTAYNVVGMLDNGQDNVVVIGAHFDHLGWGDEGSLHRGEPAIHNGADDNASGIAVLLQLTRDLLEMDEARKNDYLFIAFTGEEKGLYGSNYWTKHPTVPIEQLNYMINMDMVGRLDSAGSIGINGVGTSPAWSAVDHVLVGDLKTKTTQSGIGPSDHTSFYLQGVPAIHFFTGTHADYHKPTDDEEKINYDGMLRITRYIESLIVSLNDDGKLEFTKTEDVNTEDAPRFKVTLGVVPDYMFDGKGMRIDGITEGKPAANAGLKVGDVVVKLGALEVNDMMGYMKALAAFEKGATAPIVVLRDGKEHRTEVTF